MMSESQTVWAKRFGPNDLYYKFYITGIHCIQQDINLGNINLRYVSCYPYIAVSSEQNCQMVKNYNNFAKTSTMWKTDWFRKTQLPNCGSIGLIAQLLWIEYHNVNLFVKNYEFYLASHGSLHLCRRKFSGFGLW